MYKKYHNYRNRKQGKIRILKKILVIILLLIFGLFIFYKMNFFDSGKVNALQNNDINDIFEYLNESNPIKILIKAEIAHYDTIKIEKLLEEKITLKKKELEALRKAEVSNKMTAYLTFDDGPSHNTLKVLDILDKFDIKATFFVVGRVCNAYPEILKETYARGHSIGNHSYTHDYATLYASTNSFIKEVQDTENTLKKILGNDFTTRLFRFPGGYFETFKKSMKLAIDKQGYDSYNWNALNGDAEGHNIPKEKLLNRVIESSKGKNKIVVLMHDTDAKGTTVDSLEDVINWLVKEGYEFKPLDMYENTDNMQVK